MIVVAPVIAFPDKSPRFKPTRDNPTDTPGRMTETYCSTIEADKSANGWFARATGIANQINAAVEDGLEDRSAIVSNEPANIGTINLKFSSNIEIREVGGCACLVGKSRMIVLRSPRAAL